MTTGPVWTITQGNDILDWLSLSSYKERAGYKHTVEIGVYINEEFKHSGIGSKLLEHALHEAPLSRHTKHYSRDLRT